MVKEGMLNFFAKHYKILMFIPIIITIISIIMIGSFYAKTGSLFYKDVSISGGISATIYTDKPLTESQVQKALGVDTEVRKLTEFGTGKNTGFIIDTPTLSKKELTDLLKKNFDIELNNKNSSVQETTARFGGPFFRQLLIALLVAFILMAITVFITFRSPSPSLAIVGAAAMDIIITLAIVNLLNIKISSAGIIAFLLIVGYSIDTDILLTTWSIRKKGEGTLLNRMWHSFITGLTMTACAIAVMITGLLFSNSNVIIEMFSIVFIALIVDVFTTYLTNAGILYIWCKKKGITWAK